MVWAVFGVVAIAGFVGGPTVVGVAVLIVLLGANVAVAIRVATAQPQLAQTRLRRLPRRAAPALPHARIARRHRRTNRG